MSRKTNHCCRTCAQWTRTGAMDKRGYIWRHKPSACRSGQGYGEYSKADDGTDCTYWKGMEKEEEKP